jgi:hypothetical protein
MQELVRQAMREGALGFSTSQIDIHVGEDGAHTGALPGHLIRGA